VSILVTHAGRHGDCLWALPTVRAIAEAVGEPVDFCISHEYRSLVSLIQAQHYIREAFSDAEWLVQQTAPISPAEPPAEHRYMGRAYDKTIHLSFKGWPEAPTLAEGYLLNGQAALLKVLEMHLDRPWIKVDEAEFCGIAVGFTDEWFELKFGLCGLLYEGLAKQGLAVDGVVMAAPGSRWELEAKVTPTSWLGAAQMIQGSKIFLGCLSALAVLAAAMGKPRVLVEPNEQRHHPVFQHWDQELLKGGDGKPTFDARHVVDAVKERLG